MTKLEKQQRALASILSEHVDSWFIIATTPTGDVIGFQKYSSMRDKMAIEHCLDKYFMNKIEEQEGNFDDED